MAEEPDATSRGPTNWADKWVGAIGEPSRADGPIHLAEYDPGWPGLYEREAARIRSLLGDRVRLLEHAGSTSVPELAAKPIIDIELAVPDSADEQAYVPDLEAGGYILRGREPDWFEHRLFNGPDTAVNLHVFSAGSPEIDRTLAFRDRLRTDEGDRRLYETIKRELAARDWVYVQDYADAKDEIVAAILARALARVSRRRGRADAGAEAGRHLGVHDEGMPIRGDLGADGGDARDLVDEAHDPKLRGAASVGLRARVR